jgi:DNA-binding CsgD family transcriptional regulator/tetratricopeptide (TPR) repeat protein
MAIGPVVCPSLIGRTDELRELIDCRLAAAKGRGGFVFLCGDLGIGKSRLIRAFLATLTGGRAHYGIGYCAQIGDAPYAPLVKALARLGCAPELVPAGSKDEQVSLLCDAIERACQKRNAVVVLEDLQWADAATLDVLIRLLPALDALRLLVIATYRVDEAHEQSPAFSSLARLQRFAKIIALAPLKADEIRRLLRGALGQNPPIAASELEEIVERAEGNPFFAEELLKNVLEQRDGRGRSKSLPLTIRASVLERLAGLDATTLGVARFAAILGRSFALGPLADVCGLTNGDVLVALRRLRDLQIIEENAEGRGLFAFRHSLTRDVFYESMLLHEVRPVHERVLRILESSRDAVTFDLGYHAWMAKDAARCVRYNEDAADRARALHAYADAVRCYQRAIEFAPSSEVASALLGKAAAAAAADGHAKHALRLYAAAIARARSTNQPNRIARLRVAMAVQARLAGENERATAILDETLHEIPSGDDTLRCEIALNLALCQADRADAAAADELVAGCENAAETPLYWNVVRYLAAIKGSIDDVRRAHARYMELCTPKDPVLALRGLFNFGFVCCALGFDDEALATFDAVLEESRALRLSSFQYFACANAAIVRARQGDIETACSLVRQALSLPEPANTGPVALAAAALETGDEELIARTVSDETVESALRSGIDSTLGRFAGQYARLLHRRGEPHAARALLAKTLRLVHGPFASTESLVAAAELLDDETAGAPLDSLVLQADSARHVPLYAATVEHIRALQAARRGDDDSATGHALEAIGYYRFLGWPSHADRCAGLTLAGGLASRAIKGEISEFALSPREVEIAELVVAGTSNAAMAQRLAVSRRTVEKHLTSIYDKLRLRNRAQLVAFVARQGSLRDRS